MFWIILTASIVILIALVVLIGYAKDREYADGILGFFGALIFGGVAAMIISLTANAIGCAIAGAHYVSYGESNIAALQDNITTQGSFFLGSGTIDSEAVFYYYQEGSDGSYSLEHVPAASTSIIETSGDPKIEFYEPKPNNTWFGLVIDGYDRYKFYVPEGSILNNFTLDAK